MAIPDFVLKLRAKIGHDPLWLVGVTAVVLRDGCTGRQVLLVRRADNGQWTPVTGIVDPGEQPAAAAVRETLEEADVIAEPLRLAGIGITEPVTYANGDVSQYVDLTFRCAYVSGEPRPADGENTAAAWFDLDGLPPMRPEMLARLDQALSDAPAAAFSR
ncbi:MAG: NUDIX domain-containing protein [Micrococcales bacterium]|nr:NUDIX domain-containing protein [Micrococcales bacterium]